ncbi:hypothetical protein GGR42_001607 [Saonia flava]|uniref:DUF4271 domain-containing protein n=1 Tax=Saonia flava TaxID=523696 RepID=A0A846QZQ4_9FLAO|nr:DUF4271 domain-containing protein [Saonia flava]NJB71145.1 hypothetical protein [Saonia flava]
MEPIQRTFDSLDWITVILFSSLVFIVIAKGVFYNRFMDFIILPFNNKYIFMYGKKEKLLNWFQIFVTVFQIINFSLFIYLVYNIFNQTNNSSSLTFYFTILGLLVLFMIIKILLQYGNGYVFNSGNVISQFVFKKLSYLNYSGILMFFFNVMLCYVFKGSKSIVYLSIVLILLINVMGWLTALRNHQKFLRANFFYFILYLCALEIAPFVIIGSYLKD